ncbi:MAG: DUF1289 domain-containing protein [Parvularculales bacterium]
MASPKEAVLDSPCVGVCVVDGKSSLCRGCTRRLGEIANWSRFTPEERREILDLISVRRQSTQMRSNTDA